MDYLNIISESDYLKQDFDWPTIHWIGTVDSGFIRYTAPNGYKVYNLNTAILECEDGAFYVKERNNGI